MCTLHRELAEDAPITNLRKMSKVADASRASVTVITRRVDHAAAREAIQSSSHVWVVNFAIRWQGEIVKFKIENEKIGIRAI